jgi:hypothetical protein
MPGLDPGIHAVPVRRVEAPVEWIAGSSPAMTSKRCVPSQKQIQYQEVREES